MKHFINAHAIIMRVTGKDSRRYLNARLSNDIKILNIGDICYAAALSPQGKTEGYFSILCQSNEEFLVCCDGGDREEVIKAFKRYLVADRVVVDEIGITHALVSIFSNQEISALTNGLIFFQSKRSKANTYDVIVPLDQLESIRQRLTAAGSQELPESEFRLQALKACIPSFPAELGQDIIFSASGLDYAVSFKKGCYVGQEVIEKIDAYGRVPYLLKVAALKGKIDKITEVKVDDKLLSNDKILTHYYDNEEDKTYLFLELKNRDNILDSRLSINNNEAHLIC
jgi:folate-binding protein YgfZ